MSELPEQTPNPVDAESDDDANGRRRIPSTWGGVVYLGLAVAVIAGLVIIATGPWRNGLSLIGGSLIVAAVGRVVLPAHEAGMLGVRSRWFDVVSLIGVGVVLLVLAAVIPDQPV